MSSLLQQLLSPNPILLHLQLYSLYLLLRRRNPPDQSRLGRNLIGRLAGFVHRRCSTSPAGSLPITGSSWPTFSASLLRQDYQTQALLAFRLKAQKKPSQRRSLFVAVDTLSLPAKVSSPVVFSHTSSMLLPSTLSLPSDLSRLSSSLSLDATDVLVETVAFLRADYPDRRRCIVFPPIEPLLLPDGRQS